MRVLIINSPHATVIDALKIANTIGKTGTIVLSSHGDDIIQIPESFYFKNQVYAIEEKNVSLGLADPKSKFKRRIYREGRSGKRYKKATFKNGVYC